MVGLVRGGGVVAVSGGGAVTAAESVVGSETDRFGSVEILKK